jgi:quinoprotein glucose dehydrogenase
LVALDGDDLYLQGKQYIVLAAGGHGKLGTKPSDYVLAFALP